MIRRRTLSSPIALLGTLAVGAMLFGAAPAAAAPVAPQNAAPLTALSAPTPPATCVAPPQDVAILIDTTGSMESGITAARSTAISIANEISGASGQVALVDYRDSTDAFVAEVRQDFTTDGVELQAATEMLTPSGGGDGPEATLFALDTALNDLSWRDGAGRSIIIITDAPYHDPDVADSSLTTDSVVAELAATETSVFTLAMASYADSGGQYTVLAEATDGFVRQHSGSTSIEDVLQALVSEVVSRPWVQFTEPSYEVTVGEPLMLNAISGSSCDPLEVESWTWEFVDGDPEVGDTSGDSTEPTFATVGTYTVRVTVTTSDEQTATTTTTVTVTDAVIPPTTTPPTETTTPPTETTTPPVTTIPVTPAAPESTAPAADDALVSTGATGTPFAVLGVAGVAIALGIGALLLLRRRNA